MTAVARPFAAELLRYVEWHLVAYEAPVAHEELVEFGVGQGLTTEQSEAALKEAVERGKLQLQCNTFTRGYVLTQPPVA